MNVCARQGLEQRGVQRSEEIMRDLFFKFPLSSLMICLFKLKLTAFLALLMPLMSCKPQRSVPLLIFQQNESCNPNLS